MRVIFHVEIYLLGCYAFKPRPTLYHCTVELLTGRLGFISVPSMVLEKNLKNFENTAVTVCFAFVSIIAESSRNSQIYKQQSFKEINYMNQAHLCESNSPPAGRGKPPFSKKYIKKNF
jgi:hypothetical protein